MTPFIALPTEQKVLIAGAACALLALLFPPFYIRLQNGIILNMGYSLLFDPPRRGEIVASVDAPLVLLEWAVIAAITGVAWFIVRKRP